MSDSGFGALFAYAMGRNAANDAAYTAEFKKRMSGGSRSWQDAYYEVKLAHDQDVASARKVFAEYEAELASLRAVVTHEREKSTDLDQKLALASAAYDDLNRRFAEEKARADMLDERLFDITLRHAKLCKRTNTTET
ncbi:hypothetical protein J2D73_10260 [Acetobacter sacchari]|uniref:Uncharacterized protein n=1 Tax=Acetobacter sacchari TaxID=2661687 RepID=A0ABS3LWD6_9PROT|nr:hypothetical protein [Acetobacter sacchari]MBO1360181.1 hypothetical protein [Acetobacter sacchari]